MDLCYYPGCTLKTTAKNFEKPAIASMQKLGHKIIELPRWNCCGTVHSLATDDLMHLLAPVRNFIRVLETGTDKVVTLCAMCYNTLKQTNRIILEDSEVLEFKKLNKVLQALVNRIRKDYDNLKELTANTSHEIQTPLAIIKSKTELLYLNTVLYHYPERHSIIDKFYKKNNLNYLDISTMLEESIEEVKSNPEYKSQIDYYRSYYEDELFNSNDRFFLFVNLF